MPRHIAFLRAINVGGHVVKMDRLRQIFESIGLASVETFIASGNVIFESRAGAPTLERKIETALRETLGYEVRTFLRSAAELLEVSRYRPFPEAQLGAEGSSLYVSFLPAFLTTPQQRRSRGFAVMQTTSTSTAGSFTGGAAAS
jgi:Uncharacterized protein conserved in bacteria